MGRRLNIARLILMMIRGAENKASKVEPVSLAVRERITAKIMLEAGPARAIRAESRLGCLRLKGSKGTGFPQPKRNKSNMMLPKGSR